MKSSFTASVCRRVAILASIFFLAACNSDDPGVEQEVKVEWSHTNGPDGG